MLSVYLDPDDYELYGVPNATTAQVIKASAIIDGYLNRPDGLIYVVNLDEPVYMATTLLPITKIKKLPVSRQIALYSTPVVKILSVQSSQSQNLPPVFQTISSSVVTDNGVLYVSGQANIYDLIRIQYVAGWLYANLPSAIKQACANIITVIQQGITISSVSRIKAGQSEIDYDTKANNGNLFIDTATAEILNPYKANFL